MRVFGILLAGTLLSACGENNFADEIARDQARKVVNPVISERFPGVPLEPATNCVIDNASASEIFQLAKAGATSTISQTDAELVVRIATREETLKCLVKDGLSPFLNV
ncbi:MAG: hypothetical protein AAF340_10725 [Pseudomonadota bacterium]